MNWITEEFILIKPNGIHYPFLASYSAQNILTWNIESNKEEILKESHKLLKSTDSINNIQLPQGLL